MASTVDDLVRDFIGLYTRETLPRWRTLFLPGFTAAATNPDGSVTTWTLEEFYARQQALFGAGKPVREILHNTEVERRGDLACVRSDYVWTDGEVERPGTVMLLAVADGGKLRIQAMTFSYRG